MASTKAPLPGRISTWARDPKTQASAAAILSAIARATARTGRLVAASVRSCIKRWLVACVAYALVVRGAFLIHPAVGFIVAGLLLLALERSVDDVWRDRVVTAEGG